MTKGTFIGMPKARPDKFRFSVKVPETITHVKRLRIDRCTFIDFEEFLDKISPLKKAPILGAILFQLPRSFTVSEFRNIERSLGGITGSTGSSSSNLP
jgi:uncharacterized protein YecE (DUF72 family)